MWILEICLFAFFLHFGCSLEKNVPLFFYASLPMDRCVKTPLSCSCFYGIKEACMTCVCYGGQLMQWNDAGVCVCYTPAATLQNTTVYITSVLKGEVWILTPPEVLASNVPHKLSINRALHPPLLSFIPKTTHPRPILLHPSLHRRSFTILIRPVASLPPSLDAPSSGRH